MKKIPLLKFIIPFVLGIAVGDKINIDILYLSILLALVLTAIIFITLNLKSIPQNLFFSSLLYFAVFISGSLYISIEHRTKTYLPGDWTSLKNVEVFGEVDNVDLLRKEQVVFNVISDSVTSDDSTIFIKAKFICNLRYDNRLEDYSVLYPGNKIQIKGFLSTPKRWGNPGEPDFSSYYHYKEISGTIICFDSVNFKILEKNKKFISSFFFDIRKYLDVEIKRLHLPETAALIKGFILADRTDIEPEVNEAFINTGIVHILSVSGLHVSYIILLFLLLFSRFNLKLKYFLTAIGLLSFLLLTGFQPPVLRAVIMGLLILITYLTKRSTNLINSTLLAGFIIIIFDPYSLFDRGFILSFTSILSLAIFYPPLRDYINDKIKNRILGNVILFSSTGIIVQLGILPFLLLYYHKISFIILLPNLAAIPITGTMLGISFITLIVNTLSPLIASFFASTNDLLTLILYNIIKVFSNPDYSILSVKQFSSIDTILFYFFIGLIIILFKMQYSLKIKFIASSILLVIFFISISFDNIDLLKENELDVIMVDVGQGDAFLIKFPNGQTALIDAGDAYKNSDAGERTIIPLINYLDIDKIDYAFISHLDKDHYWGILSLITNNKIKYIVKPSSNEDLSFEKLLKNNKVNFSYYDRNYLDFGNSRIYILKNPNNITNNSNDESIVLKLVYGKTSFLFTGDLSRSGEKKYLDVYGDFLKSDVLKVAHHGSKTSSSEKFLSEVKPKYSLISTGFKNRFGHPDKEVVDKLILNSEVFRTDLEGAVILRSNGEKIEKINWQNNY